MEYWWQKAIVYQIYPRSFQDGNGDGIGDLPGIVERLDYLQWLGVTALWISPIYPSPMADFGYDVSDYTDIDPRFGTLADMDNLLAEAHRRDLKVILDFVPNHTSSQHPWFLESRSSRDNPRRDWYIWRDPAPDGGPPNNWLAHFTADSAWEWDEKTGQYYLHLFLPEQPDLNWRNPEVREAMLDVMRFWFDRGVDGFRVDVSYKVMKDLEFRDNPPDPDWQPGMDPFRRQQQKYSQNMADIHIFNRWLREVADTYDDRVLIGEIYLPILELVAHYGEQQNEFHLPFNFHLILADWTPATVHSIIEEYEAALPENAWPNWVLGNHDQSRFATRVGPENARIGMLLLLTLRGTPTIYYGDELGMEDGHIPADRARDPKELNHPGMGLGRDPERTPMQWNDGPNAGFSPQGVEPWLPVAGNFQEVNVARQRDDENSMLSFTRRLVAIRQQTPALLHGDYGFVRDDGALLVYSREIGGEQYLIVLNFSAETRTWQPPAPFDDARVIISTHSGGAQAVTGDGLQIRDHEGILMH